jgi:hypothetical protein
MTTEELLQPRYKVIADFPQWSVFTHKLGDILELRGVHFVGKGTSRSINEKDIDKYPSVLRKLQWWEERNEEELSKIKYAKTLAGNSVRTVLRFELSWDKIILDGGKVRSIKNWLPATKEEYELKKPLIEIRSHN